MKTSSNADVRGMYDQIAGSYAQMMDTEIELPIYATTLSGLAEVLVGIPGPVLDTSCGTGHLLERYRKEYDPDRALCGIDLSGQMVEQSKQRLGPDVPLSEADMRDLSQFENGSMAAVLSFFAIHHLSADEVEQAFREWQRVLGKDGRLLLASWEGSQPIDYGDAASILALRHREQDIVAWLAKAGFEVEESQQRFEREMKMNSLYLRARRREPQK